jgi:hypothetical protein
MSELIHLQNLEHFTLITNNRGGSDFLQSLLDGHPEICVFNLNFRFFTEYRPTSVVLKNENMRAVDFIDEFIGKNIERLVSFYNYVENQDTLGPEKNDSIKLETSEFKKIFLRILQGADLTIENIFLAIYGAYHIALGRDIYKTKILFHHAHNIAEAVEYKKHFPRSRLIISTRDPRTAYVSANEYVRVARNKEFDNYRNFYLGLCQTVIEDPVQNSVFGAGSKTDIPNGPAQTLAKLEEIDQQPLIVRLEDIPKREILISLTDFLGVEFHPSTEVSTWGGLEWWGDRISIKKLSPKGWTPDRTYNGWREKLWKKDIFIIDTCLYDILTRRGYPTQTINLFKVILAFLLLWLPLRYELKYLNPALIMLRCTAGGRLALHALSAPYFYFKVRYLMLRFLVAQVRGIWRRWPGVVLIETPDNENQRPAT